MRSSWNRAAGGRGGVQAPPTGGACLEGKKRRLVRQVEEEGGRAATLSEHALPPLGHLARLLAVLAADRERQRPEAALRDLLAALEAVPVAALFQTRQGLVDLLERLGLHLDER